MAIIYKLYKLNTIQCYLKQKFKYHKEYFLLWYIFLIISLYCTLTLTSDYIEKWFSAISDIVAKDTLLTVVTITCHWFGRKYQLIQKI